MKHISSLLKKVGKGEKGFTLIELLIVILILGIIAAVVILNVGGFIGMGDKQAFCTEGDTVQAAVMAWAANTSSSNCSALTGGDPDVTIGPEVNGFPDNTTGLQAFLARTPKYNWKVCENCTVQGSDLGDKCPGGYPDCCATT